MSKKKLNSKDALYNKVMLQVLEDDYTTFDKIMKGLSKSQCDTLLGTNDRTMANTGFYMSPSNTVPDHDTALIEHYGMYMTDKYGRTYLQVEGGRLY